MAEQKMRKQYLAEYQQENYEPGKWKNAIRSFRTRYYRTLEDAQAAIREVKAYFNGEPRTTTQVCGCIGISSHTDSKTAQTLMVTKTRILVRLVTDWEAVEEE